MLHHHDPEGVARGFKRYAQPDGRRRPDKRHVSIVDHTPGCLFIGEKRLSGSADIIGQRALEGQLGETLHRVEFINKIRERIDGATLFVERHIEIGHVHERAYLPMNLPEQFPQVTGHTVGFRNAVERGLNSLGAPALGHVSVDRNGANQLAIGIPMGFGAQHHLPFFPARCKDAQLFIHELAGLFPLLEQCPGLFPAGRRVQNRERRLADEVVFLMSKRSQCAPVDIENLAVDGNDITVVGLMFEKRPEPLLGRRQFFPHLVCFAHIPKNEHRAGSLTSVVANRRGRIRDLVLCAVLRDQQRVIGQANHLPALDDPADRIDNPLARAGVANIENNAQRSAERLCQRPAGQLLRNRVHAGYLAVWIGGDYCIANRIKRGAQAFLAFAQCLLHFPALADVPHKPESPERASVMYGRQGQFDGKFMPVFSPGGELADVADGLTLAALDVFGPGSREYLPVRLRHDEIVQIPAGDLLCRIAEHLLGCRIPVLDPAFFVYHNQGVERRTSYLAEPLLALLQGLAFRPFLGLVSENEHRACGVPVFILDRSTALCDRNFIAISVEEECVVGKPGCCAGTQHLVE